MSMLQGRAAIVTGSGTGLGKAIAELFLDQGASVVVNDRTSEVAAAALAQMPDPGRCAAVAGDVRDSATIAALVSTCLARFGRLDIVVNNAAVLPPGLVKTQAVEDWRQIFEVNFLAPLFLAKAALPALRRSPVARIINISGEIAFTGMMFQSAYASSKAAVNSMTKSMSRAVGGYGITVNSICPGIVTETNMVQEFVKDRPEYQAAFEMYRKNSPLGRGLRATDIADVALMLASDRAGFITGQFIRANGGAC
jgi:NAD(P)-dependent dehydrogenase (short-subunit alcohol dehydrogenase family)